MRNKEHSGLHKMSVAFRRLFLLALGLQASPAWSDVEGEFLLFTQFEGFYWNGLSESLGSEDRGLAPGVDFFAAYQFGNFLTLGEYFLNEDESELERAQIGWSFGEPQLWLGRGHNPIGLWNTQFHHGAYLQTSVSRPGMVEYEDDGGIFPLHVTGLQLEGVHGFGDRGFSYHVSVGLGPGFDNVAGALEPLNLLDPNEGEQDLATTVRLGYKPDSLGTNIAGIFVSYSTIPGIGGPVKEINQEILGTFVDWSFQRWQFTGELNYSRSQITRSFGKETGSFVNGYLQAEYGIDQNWTAYGRVEDNSDDASNPYLALFPSHVAKRQLVGFNYKIAEHHVIKFEFAKSTSFEERFSGLVFQWSVALP